MAVVLDFVFAFSEAFSVRSSVFAIFLKSVITRTKTVHDREDDFALRYVRIYPGVNSRAELVTLAALARG